MTVASFVFSAIALVLSIAAFGWQIAAWYLSGGRVRVRLHVGLANRSGLVSGLPGKFDATNVKRTKDQGFSNPVVAINVHNRGRLPVFVNRWGISTEGGNYIPVADSSGPALPHKLEPYADAVWTCPLHNMALLMQSRDLLGGNDVTRGFVELGTGKRIESKNEAREVDLAAFGLDPSA